MAGQAVTAVHPRPRGVGVIERLGAGPMYGLEPGMRVALPWLGYACGVCRYCNSGRETLCLEQQNMGYALNGGFAEYAIGYARHVVRVPDGIDPADASPLTCAGVTTYKAVKDSGARSSSLVAVFGAAAWPPRRAVRAHHRRVGDRRRHQQRAARDAPAVGAEHLINPLEQDPSPPSRPRRRRRGDLHRGQPEAFEQAFARSRAAASSSSSACRPTTTSSSRSSRPSSADSTSTAPSSAPATTSRRSSNCTAAG